MRKWKRQVPQSMHGRARVVGGGLRVSMPQYVADHLQGRSQVHLPGWLTVAQNVTTQGSGRNTSLLAVFGEDMPNRRRTAKRAIGHSGSHEHLAPTTGFG